MFRSRADAELTAKIYARVPVLIDEAGGPMGNPWCVEFRQGLFNMTSDSGLFRTTAQLREVGFVREGTDWAQPEGLAPRQRALDLSGGRDTRSLALDAGTGGPECYVPLYEAKMIHQFDHRWATYDGTDSRDATIAEKADFGFDPTPRYWVPEAEVTARLAGKSWTRGWLMGWRDVTNATNERTVIATAFPRVGVNHKTPLFFSEQPVRQTAALLANWLSLAFDYVARQKIGGTSLSYFYLKQLPVLSPSSYTEAGLAFIVPRVLELTYTSHSMEAFACDLGYDRKPFAWDEDRRALLRAELDAWYARAYGLTRYDLRYLLDPADLMGSEYPSETFRVLKKNEIARFGEYRTARLVLDAWDRMERGEIRDTALPAVVTTPRRIPVPVDVALLVDGAWANSNTSADTTLAQLAALMKALPDPKAINVVRLAMLYALEPRYLTRHLTGTQRATWRRLVGLTAEPFVGTNVSAFTPKIDAGWRSAVTQLRGMRAIIENPASQTWEAGPNLDQFEIDPLAWPYGRATFVLTALENITLDDATADLPAEDRSWVKADAA